MYRIPDLEAVQLIYIYIFNPFQIKILKITHPKLYFQELALLVAPSSVARLIVESRHMKWHN
jgi:hypothetical protein